MTQAPGPRVLIAEDEALIGMLLEDMLTSLGAQPLAPATTLAQALQLLDGAGFDVAILDLNLHGEASYPVAERLRERGIPFAFASGYGREALKADFADVPLLQKPYRLSALQALIGQLAANTAH